MTALHAAGGGTPLAVHIPHIVEQIGSLAGFAAVAGLAILSALYFSQARDLRRLREWAGRAPERAAEQATRGQAAPAPVPGRVVAVPQRTAQAVQAPMPVTPGGAPAPAQGRAQPAAPGANGAPPAEAEDAKEGDAPAEDGKPPAEGEEQKAPEGEEKKAPEGEETQADGAGADAEKPGAEPSPESGEAKPGAPAKPGMPAPASVAAAAGAGAAGVAAGAAQAAAEGAAAAAPASASAGPAAAPAPPGKPAESVFPKPAARTPDAERPPTSVLPPRRDAPPSVRRPVGTAAANRALNPTGLLDAPGADKPTRNPVYIALAVAGVLVLGAGAAIGVPKLVSGGSKSKTTATKHHHHQKSAKLPPIAPAQVTVTVLNGTTVAGLAAQVGDQAQSAGFNLGSTGQVAGILEGTKAQQANSLVMYLPGHQREATFVARKLHLTGGVRPVDPSSRQLAGNASVVIVVGRDQAH